MDERIVRYSAGLFPSTSEMSARSFGLRLLGLVAFVAAFVGVGVLFGTSRQEVEKEAIEKLKEQGFKEVKDARYQKILPKLPNKVTAFERNGGIFYVEKLGDAPIFLQAIDEGWSIERFRQRGMTIITNPEMYPSLKEAFNKSGYLVESMEKNIFSPVGDSLHYLGNARSLMSAH